MQVHQVIIKPHTSEKSHESVQDKETYVFRVHPEASKTDIRQAVEGLWNVKVKSVRTVNVMGKVKRYGRYTGRSGDWKKAIVRLVAGQAIEVLR